MIKFLPLGFLIVSHRIPRKNKNAVYCLQISALVLEICKFEKWVNMQIILLMTSYTQPNIILANLQCRTLKLGRLRILQETHLQVIW